MVCVEAQLVVAAVVSATAREKMVRKRDISIHRKTTSPLSGDNKLYSQVISAVVASSETQTKLRYSVVGSRRFGTYFWALGCTIGGVGFTLAGLSSYLGQNLLPVSNPASFTFIPQGIALLFYGLVGSATAAYQYFSLLWNLGGGYNEFDRETGTATIFREGFPGKNRKIKLEYKLSDIQSIRVELKEGLNPSRQIFLRVKGRGEIPLTRVGQPLPLTTIENQAAEMARFLAVPLEGL